MPTIIMLLVGATLAFGGGWATRDAFCDAAALKLQVSQLQRQVDAGVAAQNALNGQIVIDTADMEKLKGTIDELSTKISKGECFTPGDTDSLRGLWVPSRRG